MPSAIETALTQIRDAAHTNQAALGAIKAEAQTTFDVVRTWDDSATKRDLNNQLATVISAYSAAQREAIELRDFCDNQLSVISDTPPPLPPPDSGDVDWSVQEF